MAFRVNPTSYTFKPGQPIIISYSGTISNYSYLYGINGTPRSISSTATTMTFDPVNTKGEYQCYLGTIEEDMHVRSNNFKIIIKDDTDVIKENLYNSKKHYDTCYKSLVDLFNSILLKTEVTETDRLNLDVVLLNFRNANSNISSNFEKAVDIIATNKVKESQMETYEVIANVEVKVGEISLKANATQQTLEQLDGELSLVERRVHSAEQKITPEAITNTVSATYTTKNETHELKSVVEQQAGQIREKVTAGYVSQEITKSANQTKFDFSNSGGINLVKDSNMKLNLTKYFGHPYLPLIYGRSTQGTTKGMIGLKTRINEGCGAYQTINVKPNTDYTFSGNILSEGNTRGAKLCIEIPGDNYRAVSSETVRPNEHRTVSCTINTGNFSQLNVYIRLEGSTHNDTFVVTFIKELMFNEGKNKLPWTPHAEEIYAGNTTIDAGGVTVYNGALRVKNNAGQNVWEADSRGNVNMNIYGSVLKVSGTGGRGAKLSCDYYDKFIIEVPYYNASSGFWLKRDTGSTIISDLAGQSDYNSVYMAATRIDSLRVLGGLEVRGSKNSLQSTKNYGERLINAYETAEYYFGDIGSGFIKNGECIVLIDDIFQECINTDVQYHVFTQVYNGIVTKIERHKTYFVVYGVENTDFSWELKAKRIGYENSRLELVDIHQEEKIDDLHMLLTKEQEINEKLEDLLLGDD